MQSCHVMSCPPPKSYHDDLQTNLTTAFVPPPPQLPRKISELLAKSTASATPSKPSASTTSSPSTQQHLHASQQPAIYFDIDRITAYQYVAIRQALAAATDLMLTSSNSSNTWQQAPPSGLRLSPLRPLLHAMRLVKSDAEAERMRRSARLTAHALKRCMSVSRPGIAEYELSAMYGE